MNAQNHPLLVKLRILTPEALTVYSETKIEEMQPSQIAVGQDFVESFQGKPSAIGFAEEKSDESEEELKAKIIPLHQNLEDVSEHDSVIRASIQQEQVEEVETKDDSVAAPESDLEKLGIYSKEKLAEFAAAKEQKKKSKQDSTTVFLIKQREKLKESSTKLVGKVGIDNYVKTSRQLEEIDGELDMTDPDKDIAKGNRGVLVNKKHN